ncbi:MAG: hypothetical protein DRN96_02045 [Thermoproteota archaeon]|nr:MAG: hypothetical protein DRN96_02045 [Candidatus Korarchaeota archaeon]
MRVVARVLASPRSLFEEMRSRDMLRECIRVLILASALAAASTAVSYTLVSVEFTPSVPSTVVAEVSRARAREAIASTLALPVGWLLATALAHTVAVVLGGYGSLRDTASITLASLSALIPYYLLSIAYSAISGGVTVVVESTTTQLALEEIRAKIAARILEEPLLRAAAMLSFFFTGWMGFTAGFGGRVVHRLPLSKAVAFALASLLGYTLGRLAAIVALSL